MPVSPVIGGNAMNKGSDLKADSVKISEDVIAKITEAAVNNVEGVRGLAVPKKSFLSAIFRASKDPVSIRMNCGSAEISIKIVVSDSCKVKSAAEKIQKQVKEDVQNMTGIAVTKVNVFVKDIIFEKE